MLPSKASTRRISFSALQCKAISASLYLITEFIQTHKLSYHTSLLQYCEEKSTGPPQANNAVLFTSHLNTTL